MLPDYLKFILFILIIATLIAVGFFVRQNEWVELEMLQSFASQRPILSAFAFVGMVTLMHFLFIPLVPTSAVAGFLYGPNWGFFVALTALGTSAMSSFLIARHLGRPFFEKRANVQGKLFKFSQKMATRYGFLAVVFFRIVPLLNFLSVNTLFGISRISTPVFLAGSIAGVMPGTFLLTRAGHLIGDWKNPELYVYVGIYIAFIVITFLISYAFKKRHFG